MNRPLNGILVDRVMLICVAVQGGEWNGMGNGKGWGVKRRRDHGGRPAQHCESTADPLLWKKLFFANLDGKRLILSLKMH